MTFVGISNCWDNFLSFMHKIPFSFSSSKISLKEEIFLNCLQRIAKNLKYWDNFLLFPQQIKEIFNILKIYWWVFIWKNIEAGHITWDIFIKNKRYFPHHYLWSHDLNQGNFLTTCSFAWQQGLNCVPEQFIICNYFWSRLLNKYNYINIDTSLE